MSDSKYELITGVEDKPRKVVIYGTPCIGKSSFAEQFPSPIFIQTENAGGKIACPRLPVVKTYAEFYEQLVGVGKGEYGEYKTVVIDSLKFFEHLLAKKVCREWVDPKTKEVGITSLDDVAYGSAYGRAMCLWYDLTDMLDRFIEKGLNVVLVAHPCVRLVKDPLVDEYETITIDLMQWGKVYNPTNMLVCWSDAVIYLAHKVYTKSAPTGIDKQRTTPIGSGERVMYTEENPALLAKNRFDMPPELPFNKGEGYSVIEQYLTVQKD